MNRIAKVYKKPTKKKNQKVETEKTNETKTNLWLKRRPRTNFCCFSLSREREGKNLIETQKKLLHNFALKRDLFVYTEIQLIVI